MWLGPLRLRSPSRPSPSFGARCSRPPPRRTGKGRPVSLRASQRLAVANRGSIEQIFGVNEHVCGRWRALKPGPPAPSRDVTSPLKRRTPKSASRSNRFSPTREKGRVGDLLCTNHPGADPHPLLFFHGRMSRGVTPGIQTPTRVARRCESDTSTTRRSRTNRQIEIFFMVVDELLR